MNLEKIICRTAPPMVVPPCISQFLCNYIAIRVPIRSEKPVCCKLWSYRLSRGDTRSPYWGRVSQKLYYILSNSSQQVLIGRFD